jgi:opacity protein-like surface antigen
MSSRHFWRRNPFSKGVGMRNRIGFFFAFLLIAGLANSAQAQQDAYSGAVQATSGNYTLLQPPPDNSRANKSEIFGEVGYSLGDSTTDNVNGVPQDLKVTPSYLGGIGLGHNLGSYLNVNIDALFGPERITGRSTGPGNPVVFHENDVLGSRYMFNVEFYPFKTRITPVLTGGVGAMRIFKDNVAPNVELTEWDLAYNAGAGLRWDLKDSVSLKLIYKVTWTHFHELDENMALQGLFLTFAWRF